MKTATQSHTPPYTTFELTFDLQRFAEFDITANDQTVTLTDGADTIYIKASAFTGNGNVTLNGTFGKDDKIIVYLNDKTDGKDVFNWTSRNLPSDNSAEIDGKYNGDTWFNITVNGVTRSSNLAWSDIDANHSATVAVTVDYLNPVNDDTQAAFAIATKDRNSSTLTGINSTAGITYDVDSWCFTIPTENIYVADGETHGTVNLSGEGNLAVTGNNVAEQIGGLKLETANNKVTLKTAGYGVGYYVNNGDGGRTISYNATADSVETLLEISGLNVDEEDIISGRFIEDYDHSVNLYSNYLSGNTVTVSNNSGGYQIYISRYGDWSDKTLNYVVTGDANIYCGEFNGKLNFIDANGNLLDYTKKVSGQDVVLTVGEKSITLENATNFDTLNINGATVSTSPFEIDSDGNRLIQSAEDLINFSTYVTNGHTCEGLTFKLTANIDMTGKDFTPIGSTWDEYASFKGTFDGAGHTISGLNISDSEYSNVGLFRFNFGTIKNLNVSGTVTSTNSIVGGIVGSNSGTLDNVTFSGTVGNASYVGGLVGQNNSGTVKNSTFSGTVSGYNDVGGLIGWNGAGTITDNKVDVQITGNSNVGALVGYTQNAVTSSGNYFHSNQSNAFGYKDKYYDGSLHDISTDINGTKVLYKVTLQGFTAEGAAFTIGNNAYTNAELTLATKTGYLFGSVQSKVTVTEDTTISATFDTSKHYAFKSGDTYALANESNTTDYPDLVQVYQLTLPQGVTVEGSTVITDNGKTYAAGEVTLKAAKGYTLDNITVNGTASGDTFTVDSDTDIVADIYSYNNAGTAVNVIGTSGDFHANSTLYSITAAQHDSHIIANAKANQIIVAGGNENILTGGKGNDTFKFTAGSGGIVTDYGIGATKSGDGKALATASGSDIVKVDGTVTGIYFDRDASSKKSATFTATIVYGDDQVVVLKDIVKKPTKTGSSPIYQTNDVAAATLKIWDTSSGKQSVLSSTKLKKFFCDDDNLTGDLKTQADDLSTLVDGNNLVSTNDDILQSSTTNNGTTYIFPANGGIGGIGTGSNNPKP